MVRLRIADPKKVIAINKNKSFTLTELLIVVVIISILGGFASTYYVKSVEKAHESEAFKVLGEVRSSILRFYYQHGEHDLATTTWDVLDISKPVSSDFTYNLGSMPIPGTTSDVIAFGKREKSIPWKGGKYYIGITLDGDIIYGTGGPTQVDPGQLPQQKLK